MALSAAGTAAVHALAYPLGGKFNVPHGIAKAMGVEAEPSLTCEAVIQRMNEWIAETGIPQNLADYGVKETDIEPLALAALKVTRLLDNNPKRLNGRDIASIYGKLLPFRRSLAAGK